MAIKNREFKINCQNKKLIYKDKKKVNGDKRIKSAGNSTLDNVAKGHCRSPETTEEWAIQLQKVQSQATISPLRWKMSPRLEGIGEYPDTASGWPLCEALLWAMPSFLSRETWGQRLSICLRSHTAALQGEGGGGPGVMLRPRTSSTSSSHHHHSVSQKYLCISCRNVCIKQRMHLYFFKKTLPICFAEVVPIYILTSTISLNFSWPSQSCFPVWFFQPVKWSLISLPACLLCADEVKHHFMFKSWGSASCELLVCTLCPFVHLTASIWTHLTKALLESLRPSLSYVF